jgi:hypothetical protein
MGYNGGMERELHRSPEEIIQNLVDRLDITEGINYEFYDRGPWYKQYGNTYDPDGEYEIKSNEESVKGAQEAKKELEELGNNHTELLGQILSSLLNKKLPADETRYVISRTETGFQVVTPYPSDERGWTWVSGSDTKRIIEETILGFGVKAVPYLESVKSKRSKDLISKIKRQEFVKKVKNKFFNLRK